MTKHTRESTGLARGGQVTERANQTGGRALGVSRRYNSTDSRARTDTRTNRSGVGCTQFTHDIHLRLFIHGVVVVVDDGAAVVTLTSWWRMNSA